VCVGIMRGAATLAAYKQVTLRAHDLR
jgi:hypothetical protein